MVRNGMITMGILLMAMGQGRCGWLMHEGGHNSLTGKSEFSLVFDEASRILLAFFKQEISWLTRLCRF
jgi:hypothetical protein